MENNNFKKGDYVVLLNTCNGNTSVWSSIPIDYCYQLSDDSNKNHMMLYKDKKGKDNGWSSTGYINSQLSLRLATKDEILTYQKYNKPFHIDLVEFFKSESYEYLIPLLKELDNG